MNDSLLESQKKPRVNHLSVDGGKADYRLSNSPEPNVGANAALKILMIDRQAKINVTLNNIIMILFLNLFPFGLILSTLPNIKWFLLIKSSNNYSYWVNFLFLKEISPDNKESVTYLLLQCVFNEDSCHFNNKLKIIGMFNLLKSYTIAGTVCTLTIVMGLILHIIHFYQMIAISCTRNPNRIKGFSVITIAYFTIFMYVGSFVYWIFASSAFLDSNVSDYSFFHRLSSSVLCYVIGIVVFVLLVLWFSNIYKKGVRKNLVNDLLDAERKYVGEVDDNNSDDEVSNYYEL